MKSSRSCKLLGNSVLNLRAKVPCRWSWQSYDQEMMSYSGNRRLVSPVVETSVALYLNALEKNELTSILKESIGSYLGSCICTGGAASG